MKRLCLLAVALISVLSSFRIVAAADDASAAAAKPIRVAVFDDAGVSDKVAGLIELLNTHSELRVTKVDGNDVRGGKLTGFDVVLVPGGSGSKEAAALEESGRREIRTFVERGGGYLGICAGAYLASADYEWSLHILDAKVLDRAHWARGTGDVEVSLTEAGQKLLGARADRETILYWQGPLLAPAGKPEIADYETLGTFATEIAKNGAPKGLMPGTTAIARGTFGAGRVFCFSPHPERTPAVQGQVLKAIQWAAGR
ncbi:MAG TPA: BPL-N domain-containing protein [Pirellulaceae bacterium]|jgi:putative intracellular protease/amidase